MMLKINTNFKNRARSSSRNFANRIRCASAHCEQANADTMCIYANRTQRSLDKSLYSKIGGWNFAILVLFGLCSYLTFMPERTFAESLIVDENEKRSLSQIDTMQEMSQQICINSRENETKQLRDTRDDKIYWVTKLKDGNCWMTQNLDYNSPSSILNTPPNWRNDISVLQFYDPGDYIYTTPDQQEYCRLDGNYPNNFVYCSNSPYKWVNVSNKIPSNNPMFDTTPSSTEYNSHYHIGNYYSWIGAKDGLIDNSQGICPDGWKLPDSAGIDESFQSLLTSYGISYDLSDNKVFNDQYDIRLSPIFLLNGGYTQNNEIVDVGSGGYYWAYTYGASEGAHGLSFTNILGVNHLYNNNYYRYQGFSVRCLAEGGWLDNYPEYTDTGNANISVTVSPVISIDATSSMEGEVDFTTISRGDISATISSNQNYKVLLGTSQSTLEQNPKLTNHNIPMVENDQSIIAGISKWGVRKLTNSNDIKKEQITDEYDRTITQVTVNTPDTNITNTTATGTTISTSANYGPIGLFAVDSDNSTIKDNSILFYDTGESGISKVVFPVAIAVDAQLPGGKYFTEVVITAVAN